MHNLCLSQTWFMGPKGKIVTPKTSSLGYGPGKRRVQNSPYSQTTNIDLKFYSPLSIALLSLIKMSTLGKLNKETFIYNTSLWRVWGNALPGKCLSNNK